MKKQGETPIGKNNGRPLFEKSRGDPYLFDDVKKSKSTLMFYKKFSISLENLVGKVENLSKYPLYEKAKNLFKGALYSLEVK